MKNFSILCVLVGIAGLLLLGAPTDDVWADGTETLGPPSIPISQGTDVVAAGVGLAQSQPGDIVITVPAGAAVTQVLLYWEGFMATDVPGDDTITVNDFSVTGTLIGGQSFFFSGAYSSAFRADITSLGLVGPGTNTLTVGDLVFSDVSNGAGVVVIYDDGSGITDIDIRDGLDLAFINFPEPRKSTIAQTFTFSSSPADRVGTLAMFFSSVAGTASTGGPLRPSSIDITVAGTTTTFSNQLDSNDGQEWDTVNAAVTIPAGATSLTVQAFSRDDSGDGQDPLAASFTWTAAAFSIQGCSIGDYVWEDADRDGCQGSDERGINGVTVQLYNNCNFEGVPKTFETITKDGQDGFYEFKNLVCGQQYGIRFVNPNEIYAQTVANSCLDDPDDPDSNDDTKDSDCEELGNVCATAGDENAAPGSNNPTIDCGYVCQGEIGDRVWLDLNGTLGCQDSNEPSLEGITVTLFETCEDPPKPANQVGVPAITDAFGNYRFTGLCPGNYLVKFTDPLDRNNTETGNVCAEDPENPLIGGGGEGSDSNCGDPVLECVTLDSENVVDLTIDCGKVPPCLLEVEKFCSVPVSPEPFICSDAKPIDSLSMIWGFDQEISRIAVYRDKYDSNDPSKNLMYTIDGPINIGDEVTAAGYAAVNAPNDVDWFITFADGSTGISRFHRSCSDEDMNGPEDCQKNEGNAKSTDPSFVNDWRFEGMAGNGLTLDCTPEALALSEQCDVFGVKPGSCEDDKPTALVFDYTGADCSATTNFQEGKFTCAETGALGDLVNVEMTKDAGKFMVEIDGNRVKISYNDPVGKEFPSEIKYKITGSTGNTQSQALHTSCSKPLNVGDQFGALILTEFFPKGVVLPSANVIYTYRITNSGTFARTVDVVDDQLGPLADDLVVPEGETVELTESVLLSEPGTVTNVVTVTDIVDEECVATDAVTVNVVEPPASCEDGKPTALVFAYTGENCSATTNFQEDKFKCEETGALGNLVNVVMTKDANKFMVEIDGNSVKISYNDPVGKEFPSEIKYKITGSTGNTQSQTLHTSCSKPLNVGDQFGALILKTFIPKN